MRNKITPFLWYDGDAEEAINFYVSVFKNSKIVETNRHGDHFLSGTFVIDGQELVAFNGGPMFKFTEAVSLYVDCANQEEVDTIWNKFLEHGGQASRCGWLKDKYGLSWQIIPEILTRYLWDKDPAKSGRVMEAMMKMNKIIVKDLVAAYEGK